MLLLQVEDAATVCKGLVAAPTRRCRNSVQGLSRSSSTMQRVATISILGNGFSCSSNKEQHEQLFQDAGN